MPNQFFLRWKHTATYEKINYRLSNTIRSTLSVCYPYAFRAKKVYSHAIEQHFWMFLSIHKAVTQIIFQQLFFIQRSGLRWFKELKLISFSLSKFVKSMKINWNFLNHPNAPYGTPVTKIAHSFWLTNHKAVTLSLPFNWFSTKLIFKQ